MSDAEAKKPGPGGGEKEVEARPFSANAEHGQVGASPSEPWEAKVIEHEFFPDPRQPEVCFVNWTYPATGEPQCGRPRSEHRASAGEVVPAPPVFAPAFTEYVRRPATPEAAPSGAEPIPQMAARVLGLGKREADWLIGAFGNHGDARAREERLRIVKMAKAMELSWREKHDRVRDGIDADDDPDTICLLHEGYEVGVETLRRKIERGDAD